MIGFETDRLTPPQAARELAARLPRLQALHVLPSLYGHDGFLKEAATLKPLIADALASPAAPALETV